MVMSGDHNFCERVMRVFCAVLITLVLFLLFSGSSRKCFHGVPLIIPVALHGDFIDTIQSECKAAAAAAALAAAPSAAAEEEVLVHEANDYEDLWGVPLLQYLTNHR